MPFAIYTFWIININIVLKYNRIWPETVNIYAKTNDSTNLFNTFD